MHGGWLVPIFALAHEHDPDPEMRPYKEAISAEAREKLIVGAAAGVTVIYHYFEAQRLGEGSRLITLRPSAARCERLAQRSVSMRIRKEIQAVRWKNYAPLNCFNLSSHRDLLRLLQLH
jgi:hypothetical protein